MTVDDVRARVDAIMAQAGDDEGAHAAEDTLFIDVLKHIAETAPPEQAELAAAALKSTKIAFERWCA